jgi:hypothetical protein
LGGATIACVEELFILLALVLHWDILRKNKMIHSQAALLVSNPVLEQPERTGPFTHYLLGMVSGKSWQRGDIGICINGSVGYSWEVMSNFLYAMCVQVIDVHMGLEPHVVGLALMVRN